MQPNRTIEYGQGIPAVLFLQLNITVGGVVQLQFVLQPYERPPSVVNVRLRHVRHSACIFAVATASSALYMVLSTCGSLPPSPVLLLSVCVWGPLWRTSSRNRLDEPKKRTFSGLQAAETRETCEIPRMRPYCGIENRYRRHRPCSRTWCHFPRSRWMVAPANYCQVPHDRLGSMNSFSRRIMSRCISRIL